MFGLRLMFGFFWFCLGFFLVLTLKKLKKLKVFLVFWIKWWLKKCEKPKKLKVFFGFSLRSQKETKATNTQKPKNTLSFFGFSQFFNHHFIQKTKKTLSFFSFFKVKTKKNQKNLGKTKKNQTWASDQTFSEKFWFFGFLEVFLILSIELSQRVSKYCFLLVFSRFFVFFGFSPWILSKRVVKYCFFLFPTCFDSVHSYYPQDIFKK